MITAEINIADIMDFIYPDNGLDTLNCVTQKAILSGLTTGNALYTGTGRVYSILKEGFNFSIQEQQSHKKEHSVMETMPYTAWEPSAGTVSGIDYTVDGTFNEVTHDFYHIFFPPEFDPPNAFLADMHPQLPEGAEIQKAILTPYQTGGGDDTYDVSVHKLINHMPDLNQADGYTYDGINGWTPNDICYENIPLAQADIAPAADVNSLDQELGYKEWDVTDMVKEWVSGMASNYGLMLNSDSEASSDSYRFFGANENINPEQLPKLEFVYSKNGV